MPNRMPHPCPRHGWVLVPYGADCPECAGQPALERPSDQRPSAAKRGYDATWRQVRDEWLNAHPYCADPYQRHDRQVKAVLVDHVRPLRQGGKDDKSNYQSLCYGCHEKKKSIERHARGMGS
jgi:5-methylcytosine-specific restriction enzyme A